MPLGPGGWTVVAALAVAGVAWKVISARIWPWAACRHCHGGRHRNQGGVGPYWCVCRHCRGIRCPPAAALPAALPADLAARPGQPILTMGWLQHVDGDPDATLGGEDIHDTDDRRSGTLLWALALTAPLPAPVGLAIFLISW